MMIRETKEKDENKTIRPCFQEEGGSVIVKGFVCSAWPEQRGAFKGGVQQAAWV